MYVCVCACVYIECRKRIKYLDAQHRQAYILVYMRAQSQAVRDGPKIKSAFLT